MTDTKDLSSTNTRKFMMNKQYLIILSIIGAGIFGIVYASGTSITDTSITTPNLTVTGTCTGCGSQETLYSTWTLQYNETYHDSTIGNGGPTYMIVGNDGYVFTANAADMFFLFDPSGNLKSTVKNNYNYVGALASMVQSETGIYKGVFDTTNGTIYLYKNNVVAHTFNGGNCSNCNGFNFFTQKGIIAISPNGQYFAIAGQNSTNSWTERILLYKGS